MSEAIDPVRTMHRFRAAHEAEWLRLEAIVAQAERKSVRALSDADLFALPSLYRAALSSLSVARETSLDKALVDYLESLATRAYMFVYGVRTPPAARIARFFVTDWPGAMRALWPETLVAIAMMLAGTIAGFLLVRQDPAWFYAIIPADLAGGRDPAATRDALLAPLRGGGAGGDMLGAFAAMLFTHNAQIAILSFALGFALGLPTMLLIAYNGAMLGAFLALYLPHGLGWELGGWLTIHGTTELFAIALAGAAGLRIGRSVAFPGRATRLAAATEAGHVAATAMVGVVLMLLVAGLLEGIGRQTVTALPLRYLVGVTALVGWSVYYYVPRRPRR